MICVDASLAVKWILPEAYSAASLALTIAAAGAGERLVAPPLLPFEGTNTIRRRMVRNALPLPDAVELLARFRSFPVHLLTREGLSDCALAVAATYGLPAA